MIKLDISITEGGQTANCILTLDPFYVEAVGMEKIAADAAGVCQRKLSDHFARKRQDDFMRAVRNGR